MKRYITTVHKKGLHYAIVNSNITGKFKTEIELVRQLKQYPFNIDLSNNWHLLDNIGNNAEFEVINIFYKDV
jgi:hypothetical protein